MKVQKTISSHMEMDINNGEIHELNTHVLLVRESGFKCNLRIMHDKELPADQSICPQIILFTIVENLRESE